jgi:hypothetical protein
VVRPMSSPSNSPAHRMSSFATSGASFCLQSSFGPAQRMSVNRGERVTSRVAPAQTHEPAPEGCEGAFSLMPSRAHIFGRCLSSILKPARLFRDGVASTVSVEHAQRMKCVDYCTFCRSDYAIVRSRDTRGATIKPRLRSKRLTWLQQRWEHETSDCRR